MTKADLLDAAEIFDSFRVVPRVIIFSYLGLFGWSVAFFSWTYFHLPAAERTATLTAFASVVLSVMAGAFPLIYKIYSDAGRDWDAAKRPAVVVAQQNNVNAA